MKIRFEWLDKLIEWVRNTFRKEEPKQTDPTKHINKDSVGYRIRLKDYKDSPNRTHRGRKVSIKIDTRFYTNLRLDSQNTVVKVDDGLFEFYGVDAEHGKHDLCFADKNRFPEQFNKPCFLKIYKDRELHTVLKINEWKYGSYFVEKEIELNKQ